MVEDYIKIFVDEEYPTFIDKYLKTKTLERIKDVGQFCGCDYTKLYNIRFFYSRFDHSLVTAHITWHFTHDKLATIAALLHDVGTPVFAHTIDYVFGDFENQESSEKNICDVIKEDKELVGFLKSDGILLSDLEDLSRYPILENKSPRLCADRLDGVLHTSYIWLQKKSLEEIREVYDNIIVLTNEDGKKELGFNSGEKALKFVEMVYIYAMELQGNKDKFVMKYIADAVKKLQERNLITMEDLYTCKEKDIVKTLEENVASWHIFKDAKCLESSNEKPNCYYVSLNSKKRNVIPLVKENDKAKRIDECILEAKKIYDDYFSFRAEKYAFISDIKKVD